MTSSDILYILRQFIIRFAEPLYYSFVFREMVNFYNTINYLATQMNNETSFKQHNKERFILVAGEKE